MRFLDSSTFLYAILKPAKQPPPQVVADKKKAQAIITRIHEGEQVLTTVVHISEIANILESRTTQKEARVIVSMILDMSNITVTTVDKKSLQTAIHLAERYNIGVNDAHAINTMKENNIQEIYSNDKHFDNHTDIARIWQ
jgi:predicted nucleic acid-binding protein